MKNGFFTACSLRGGMFTGRTAVRGAFDLTYGFLANFGPTPNSDHFCSFCLSPIGRQIVRQSLCFDIRKQVMKSILKSSLLMLAVAAIAATQVGNAVAQSPTDISADPTVLFLGTIADAPSEADGSASAYYDPATGEVSLVVGAGAISLGVGSVNGVIIDGNFTGIPGPVFSPGATPAPLPIAALEPNGFGLT